MKETGNQPCAALKGSLDLGSVDLNAYPELGQEAAGSDKVNLGDGCKAAEHAVDIGGDVLPVVEACLLVDEGIRGWI